MASVSGLNASQRRRARQLVEQAAMLGYSNKEQLHYTKGERRWDGINNLDCGVFKNNRFGGDGRFNLQFRAEFFNIFNHPRFGIAGMQLGNATFGVVSSQGSPTRTT